ncbi:MAG: penicillin-binding protein 1C, partial [Hyphomonadaceae bacterium]
YVLAPLVLLDLAFPPPMDRVQHVSAVVTDERGAVLRAYPVDDGKWRMRAHLDEIDPAFVRALLAYEDKRFRQHGGVDPLAIVRAASSAVSAGRIVSGGSTITMQTARLLEPRPRNFGSKIIESLRAMQLEQRYTKDQILELYLTLAPYGGNLEGVRAASWAYFGREPQNLSPDQIAMLIALPQSPEARRPDLHPKNAVKARARVLDRLANEGVFARDLAEESSEYPPPTRRDFPAMAWHAADEALRQSPNHDGRDIRTTLDFALQRELETLARRTGDALPDGAQAAIIVVDIRTRAVRGLVGSARRDGPGGWLDLTNRSRSPGSTLKPFIYGLAFDDGVASPNTTIADAPKRFASYRPSNFDRTFRGDVTVAQALQHSLNVPAVETLDAVGANRFAAALAMAGADLSMPLSADDDAGLAIALGGAGLTARELVSLYAALGDGGVSHPLVWLEDQVETKPKKKRDPSDGVRVMSEESAGEIVSILAASPAPEGRMPAKLTKNAPVIAFKTGTSYGFRDAWAAGVAGGYAAVVWIGRADGAPRPNATGRATALPVLFEAFDAVERIRPQNDHDLRNTHVDDEAPPQPLARFGDPAAAPHILFPPDKSEVWNDHEHRSLVFAAEGAGPLRWFVDGAPVRRNAAGDAVWRPDLPGFYEVSVVDEHGREARSRIRIRTPEG